MAHGLTGFYGRRAFPVTESHAVKIAPGGHRFGYSGKNREAPDTANAFNGNKWGFRRARRKTDGG
jgi:hypothetical protein